MKKLFALFLLLFCVTYTTLSQSNINHYKYVIVPEKFDFLTTENEYRLNELTKFLFEKNGFTAYMDKEALPNEALANNCLVLNANVLKEPGIFKTKLKVQLVNCKNDIIYTSEIGESREKQYKVAYNLALRDAFQSFQFLNYKYQESKEILAIGGNSNDAATKEIETLKKEIQTLKETKAANKEGVTIPTDSPKEKTKVLIEQPVVNQTPNMLYAQKTATGFQLLDEAQKEVFNIQKTGMKNVFLIVGKVGVIYQLDANWVYEYYENNKLITQLLNIKF